MKFTVCISLQSKNMKNKFILFTVFLFLSLGKTYRSCWTFEKWTGIIFVVLALVPPSRRSFPYPPNRNSRLNPIYFAFCTHAGTHSRTHPRKKKNESTPNTNTNNNHTHPKQQNTRTSNNKTQINFHFKTEKDETNKTKNCLQTSFFRSGVNLWAPFPWRGLDTPADDTPRARTGPIPPYRGEATRPSTWRYMRVLGSRSHERSRFPRRSTHSQSNR